MEIPKGGGNVILCFEELHRMFRDTLDRVQIKGCSGLWGNDRCGVDVNRDSISTVVRRRTIPLKRIKLKRNKSLPWERGKKEWIVNKYEV